ncbi:MAG: GreA/GreB family elongation factor [Planctomycetota bacterium]
MELVQLARQNAYADLESAWEQALMTPDTLEPASFLEAASVLTDQGQGERAAALLTLLAEALTSKDAHRQARLDALVAAAQATSRPRELRADILAAVRGAHSDRPGVEAYLKLSRFEDENRPLKDALSDLLDYLDFPIGRHLEHRGWGVGVVRAVDNRSGDLEIDFERKKDHTFPVLGAVKFLERLPDASFRARAFSESEVLQAMAKEDPAELIRIVVRSRGGTASRAQVKQDLTERVISATVWSKAWTKAKKVLTLDPLVEITGGTKPVITLREAELSFADEVATLVAQSKALAASAKHVRRFIKEAGKQSEQVAEDDRIKVAAVFAKSIEKDSAALEDDQPGLLVFAQMLLEELVPGETPPLPESVLALPNDLERFAEIADGIPDKDSLKRYIKRLHKAKPKGLVERFAVALTVCGKDVFQQVLPVLRKENPGRLAEALTSLVAAPMPPADPFLELCRQTFAGNFEDLEGAPSASSVFDKLITYSDRVERRRAGGDVTAPNLRPKLKALLGAKKQAAVRAFFEAAPRGTIRHTYRRVISSRALEDEVREAARSVVVRRFPDLFAEKRHFWEDEAVIFTTQRGLDALHTDFEDLANNRIPENARAIGEAASHGDLSENAEYTAALEERDRLTQRAARLEGELQMARLLEEEEIGIALVAPGTTVQLIDTATNKPETYTILGPWDVDLDKKIISYTAPLAQGLLGRQVGDEAEIRLPGGEHRSFQVTGIEAAK